MKLQKLNEGLSYVSIKGYNAALAGTAKIPVMRNPSGREAIAFFDKWHEKADGIRGLIDNDGDLYIWPTMYIDHEDMSRQLGASDEDSQFGRTRWQADNLNNLKRMLKFWREVREFAFGESCEEV